MHILASNPTMEEKQEQLTNEELLSLPYNLCDLHSGSAVELSRDTIREYLERGKIPAVKFLRSRLYGCSLKQAKDQVDRLVDQLPEPAVPEIKHKIERVYVQKEFNDYTSAELEIETIKRKAQELRDFSFSTSSKVPKHVQRAVYRVLEGKAKAIEKKLANIADRK